VNLPLHRVICIITIQHPEFFQLNINYNINHEKIYGLISYWTFKYKVRSIMKVSDLFVAKLEEEGTEYIFGLPGEENLDFLESLRISGIKLIVTRHEQAAAFMATTYERLTGKPGVCFSTLGPGATNLITGVAQAQLIGAPFI
jgi:hypothetical protein